MNQSYEGYQVKLADPGAATTGWHLSFEEMSDQELAALEALFQNVEGSLTPFTFLDPVDNLLAWSEQQNQAVWQADPLLTLTSGVADPFGGTAAYQVSNATAATLTLQQLIKAPASLNYCLSLYARSDQSTRVWLVRGSESGCSSDRHRSGHGRSRRGNCRVQPIRSASGSLWIRAPRWTSFGIQAEAQAAASLYKRTSDAGGVYPNARFRDDTLTLTTVGPSRHSCELDIVNVEYL